LGSDYTASFVSLGVALAQETNDGRRISFGGATKKVAAAMILDEFGFFEAGPPRTADTEKIRVPEKQRGMDNR